MRRVDSDTLGTGHSLLKGTAIAGHFKS